MNYEGFYRYIVFQNGAYHIIRNNQQYGSYRRVEDALYERDRLVKVDWNWDLLMELEETDNAYMQMELPPFGHNPKYIYFHKESWIVRGKGKSQRYCGIYPTLEEAKEVARMYDANVNHRKPYYEVTRRIDGKTRYFGRFDTYEQAEKRVNELEGVNWNANYTE